MYEILLSIQVLTCSEFDYLMAGLINSDLPMVVKRDLYVEMIKATEQECFNTEDAND